jgi:hypothetical protein
MSKSGVLSHIMRPADLDREVDDGRAAAAYVAELSAGLAAIARRHGLDTLGYILDMAQEEAQHNAGLIGGRRQDQ